ncbi:hypothetical protein D3C71_1415640 [compost metagenome]
MQVNVFLKNKPNDIIAQASTNPGGKWTVHLNPGNYNFEFYHPEFDVIVENKIV